MHPAESAELGLENHALILAAGGGSRLGRRTPKCLTPIGGIPLIHHQLASLDAADVSAVTVVVGYRAGDVVSAVEEYVSTHAIDARYVVNDVYSDTNSLYSFGLAASSLRGLGRDTFVLNSDVLFDPELVERLEDSGGSAIAFDTSSGSEDEQMKVLARNGRLVEMAKDLHAWRCQGENVGVLRLAADALEDAFDAAERILRNRSAWGSWLAMGLNQITFRHHIRCVDVVDLPWVEIDFPEDLEHARMRVWPEIHAAAWERRAVATVMP